MDVAAGEDTDGRGEDIEWGAWERFEAIGAGVGVATAGFDLQAWGGELKIPSDTVQDVWVGVVGIPISGAGLLQEEPKRLPLEIRRGRQRIPDVAIVVPPPQLGLLPVPLDKRTATEDRAVRKLKAQLTRRVTFRQLPPGGLFSHETIITCQQSRPSNMSQFRRGMLDSQP